MEGRERGERENKRIGDNEGGIYTEKRVSVGSLQLNVLTFQVKVME